MGKSLYKRKTKLENASELDKTHSSLQLKFNQTKKLIKRLDDKNKKRLKQNTRDHNFIDIFREDYPEEYKIVVKKYQERYGKDVKL